MGESAGRISEPELFTFCGRSVWNVQFTSRLVSFFFCVFFVCDLYVKGYTMSCNR